MDEINNIKKNSEDYLENSLRVFKTNKLHLDTIIKISNLCINSIENGKFDPSLTLTIKLTRFFEASLEEIFIHKE